MYTYFQLLPTYVSIRETEVSFKCAHNLDGGGRGVIVEFMFQSCFEKPAKTKQITFCKDAPTAC